MYDENVRYITGTLTPGWNRLQARPALRDALRRWTADPFRTGRSWFRSSGNSPWIPKTNVRHSFRLDQRRGRSRSTQQVNKFAAAVIQAMKDNGVAGQKLGVDFVDSI